MHITRTRSLLIGTAAFITLALPGVALAQQREFNIPSQTATKSIPEFARQAGIQIVAPGSKLRGLRTPAIKGAFDIREALRALLRGSGLRIVADDGRTITLAVAPRQDASAGAQAERDSNEEASVDAGATPEILVTGQRGWTLNADIRRTENDAQPYVVFDRERIARSGQTTLEGFLRDELTSNVSVSTANQMAARNGLSNINLRGLGQDETLILVDGRRLASVNTGSGNSSQPSITGIPLSAVERIEVLPSTASGIYGGGATGGVVNIVLKRDYRGLELTGTYGGTFDGGAVERRIEGSAGVALEGGKTNIIVNGSWRKSAPLLTGDRDLVQRGRAWLADNNPTVLYGGATSNPPLPGATPNIRSSNGANLTLDPAFGGGSLGSSFTYVPYGYRGVALDGVAGLVANAGRYNLDLPPTAVGGFTGTGGGTRYSLLGASEAWAINGTVRREFSPAVTAFLEFGASSDRSLFYRNGGTTTAGSSVLLPANAPNNPFQQAIRVTFPTNALDGVTDAKTESLRGVAGVTIKMPFDWKAAADFTWNRTRSGQASLPVVDPASASALANGTLDVIRDTIASPLAIGLAPTLPRSRNQSELTDLSVRFAGPLPITLPGGKITLSMLLESRRETLDEALGYQSSTTASSLTYTPSRSQTVNSFYAEARVPVFAPANNVPLMHLLEFQLAGRIDDYRTLGAAAALTCVNVARPLTPADLTTACPAPGSNLARTTNSFSSINPTLGVRWQPVPDLTLRGSYATGFLPPSPGQLVGTPNPAFPIFITDPQRCYALGVCEPIGTDFFGTFTVPVITGGNPDLKPETSTSWSAGGIFTPRFVPGLRISADWNRIDKRNNVFDPTLLAFAGLLGTQSSFDDFVAYAPGRVTRGPSTPGFSVGPITALDLTLVNISRMRVETIDFGLDYTTAFAGGRLSLTADATRLISLEIQTTASVAPEQYAGIVGDIFQVGGASGASSAGGVKWRGNGTLQWSNDRWSIGWRTRYFGPYRSSVHVDGQTYHDLFGSFRILDRTELRAGVNNLFNKRPPIDPVNANLYSSYGDPRLANFYLSLSQKF